MIMAALVFAALAAAGYLLARYWQTAQPAYSRIEVGAPCDLRAGPCSVSVAGGLLEFAIGPRDIPLMRPLSLQVEVANMAVEGVTVEIRGLNMDMGLNRTRLHPLGNGRWQGETILPICSQRVMEWEAAVQLTGAPDVEVPFTFHTSRP